MNREKLVSELIEDLQSIKWKVDNINGLLVDIIEDEEIDDNSKDELNYYYLSFPTMDTLEMIVETLKNIKEKQLTKF